MKTAVWLSFVALVACSSAGMLGLRLHDHDRPASEPVAAQLQAVLASAAGQAVPTSELRAPTPARELAHPGLSPAHPLWASGVWLRPAIGERAKARRDARDSIRLTCRGARVPHSSDEPPERPRSLS